MMVSTAFAEPPSSSYGLPSLVVEPISSGYNYAPLNSYTEYYSKPVGRQPNEGLHLDERLLSKIKKVLIAHENSNSGGGGYTGGLTTKYGPPEWHGYNYGKVVGINFDHLQQSIPVAYYLGTTGYAQSHGYDTSSVTSGWSKPISSGWDSSSISSGWESRPISTGWSKDAIVISKPSAIYGTPKW
jgi:hypothetical protein